MSSHKTSRYIQEKHYKTIIKLNKEGKGNTAIAKQLQKSDARLELLDKRNLRRIIERLFLSMRSKRKIMVYDIETSENVAHLWNTGKQFVGHSSLKTETNIVTVAWKWLGDNQIHHLKWTEDDSLSGGNDEKLMKEFLPHYNKADMVIGWNNNSFDNKLITTRAIKYDLFVNRYTKSFDIMRKLISVARQPSNSMAYWARFLGLQGKLNHSGIKMWEDIQWGSPEEKLQAMNQMILYNVQDVALTEEIYIRVRKYLPASMNIGTLLDGKKCTCPNCNSEDLRKHQTQSTPKGYISRIMVCNDCQEQFSLSNFQYLKTI